MGARKNLLLRKHTLASASFIASMLLFVSSAYALNNSSVSLGADSSEQSEIEIEHTDSQNTESDSSLHENSVLNDSSAESNNDELTFDANDPVRPFKPNAPQSAHDVHVEIETNSANESGTPDEDEHISISGTEVTNDSNVRIRVRNSSSTEINGDEVDDNSGSIKLNISETISTH